MNQLVKLKIIHHFTIIMDLKVIHRSKNLFCYVAHICNLVQEFNGLVSKRVDRKISPFYFIVNQCFFTNNFSFSSFHFLLIFSRFTSAYRERLTLFHEQGKDSIFLSELRI